MLEAKQEVDWYHTSAVISIIATIASFGKRTVSIEDVHPILQQRKLNVKSKVEKDVAAPIEVLRKVFIERRGDVWPSGLPKRSLS